MKQETLPLIMLLTFLSFATLTFLHDPILHALPALAFGWNVDSWVTGIMTGSTTVSATSDVTSIELWIFYMLPSLTLTTLSLFSVIIYPIRIVIIPALILFMLNIPSLNPFITGSDASMAVEVLIESGISTAGATLTHIIIFLLFIAIFAFFLYITIEDEPKDAERRTRSITK